MKLHEGESLCRGTVIYVFQTMFHVMFHSVLSRLFMVLVTMPMGCQKHSLQYPLNLCFAFLWPVSWVNALCQSKRNCLCEEKGINLLQAIHQMLFVLSCVVGCSSGVMHNFYLFLLLKLLKKQEMTVALRRLSLGDTQMLLFIVLRVPIEFLSII